MRTNKSLDDTVTDILFSVRQSARPIEDLPEDLAPQNLDDCYDLQDRLNEKLQSTLFGPAIGYKIGCTTTVMQEYLDIPHPCAGRMFEVLVKNLNGTFKRNEFCRPGVECEVAVELAADMISNQPFTQYDCADYVRSAMASIELVDDRWTDFKKVATPILISENFFNAACVLGPAVKLSSDDLKSTKGTMWINGKAVGSGTGADILGHPYEALAWLANHQVRRGVPLRTGTVITLGSVVETQWIDRNDVVEIEFSGLGRASLSLT
jgi:2-keto-4-pentenoate hydratase